MTFAIRVENLGKRYALGRTQPQLGYSTLRDLMSEAALRLIRPASISRAAPPQAQRDFWALRNVNLEVGQGEKLAIVGHNGAGKSTLLKILSRITEPTEGRVTIRGRIASLLEVGTGFHPELTGRENIYLNGSILGMSHREIDRKFDEIVDFSGVEAFLDTPVKRYSSGMRMRLGFAVAAHLESEILVIDEVLAVGDAAFQKKCLGKMDEVSRTEGRTILFVSHNMGAVQQLCRKAVLLSGGQVEDAGTSEAIAAKYMRMGTYSGEYKYRDGIDFNQVRDLEAFVGAFPYLAPSVSLTFVNTTGEELRDVSFNFALMNQRNERILQISSNEVSDGFSVPPGEFEINLQLEQGLPLSPGIYTLDAHFHSPTRGNITIVYAVAQFEVSREAFNRHQFRHLSMTAEPALMPAFRFDVRVSR